VAEIGKNNFEVIAENPKGMNRGKCYRCEFSPMRSIYVEHYFPNKSPFGRVMLTDNLKIMGIGVVKDIFIV
jgi:hypothetical protein